MSHVTRVSDSDALALLALQSAPICRQTTKNMDASGDNNVVRETLLYGTLQLAYLKGHNFEYTMRKTRVTIGRSSNLEDVDVKIGQSTFVSRVHLEIICADAAGVERPKFFIKCRGKNGIFVDGVFRRKGADAIELPNMYVLLYIIFHSCITIWNCFVYAVTEQEAASLIGSMHVMQPKSNWQKNCRIKKNWLLVQFCTSASQCLHVGYS